MTTIVYKDGVLACDSHTTQNGSVVWTGSKIVKAGSRPAKYFAMCGDASMQQLFIGWYQGGCNIKKIPPTLLQGDFEVLVVFRPYKSSPNVKVIWYDSTLGPRDLSDQEFIAMGSGATVALGALHHGATAREAVEIACKVDTCTGEPVHFVEV